MIARILIINDVYIHYSILHNKWSLPITSYPISTIFSYLLFCIRYFCLILSLPYY